MGLKTARGVGTHSQNPAKLAIHTEVHKLAQLAGITGYTTVAVSRASDVTRMQQIAARRMSWLPSLAGGCGCRMTEARPWNHSWMLMLALGEDRNMTYASGGCDLTLPPFTR
eukprot:3028819-Amphidinium_carterae.1